MCGDLGYEKKVIKQEDICEALVSGRVLVVTYVLDNNIWKWISKHLTKKPRFIVRERNFEDVKLSGKVSGHALVIVGGKRDYYIIKNSWGQDFGTGGYFRVEIGLKP